MVLYVDSDAVYLVAPKTRIQIAGYYCLYGHSTITNHTRLNGAILVEYKILRRVVSSAAEVEMAGVFHSAQIVIPIQVILEAMSYPQPPIPINQTTPLQMVLYTTTSIKKTKVMGHEILLAKMQGDTTAFQIILG